VRRKQRGGFRPGGRSSRGAAEALRHSRVTVTLTDAEGTKPKALALPVGTRRPPYRMRSKGEFMNAWRLFVRRSEPATT
jgi:hypothetical protein